MFGGKMKLGDLCYYKKQLVMFLGRFCEFSEQINKIHEIHANFDDVWIVVLEFPNLVVVPEDELEKIYETRGSLLS